MFYFMMTAGSQQVIETNEVALNVAVGVGNAIADSRTGVSSMSRSPSSSFSVRGSSMRVDNSSRLILRRTTLVAQKAFFSCPRYSSQLLHLYSRREDTR